MIEITLKATELPNLKEPISLKPGKSYQLTLISGLPRVTIIEFEDKLFRTNSAVVVPERENPQNNNEIISAVGVVATCLRFAQENPDRKLFITGHTDTAGGLEYNRKLSAWRAENILNCIIGNGKRFAEICCSWDRMTVADYQQILIWIAETRGWDCHPGPITNSHNQTTQTAVNNFRKTYNEKGPGASWAPPINPWYGEPNTKPTWEGYFNCYEEYLAEQLGGNLDDLKSLRSSIVFAYPNQWSGCNEYQPRVAKNLDEFPCDSNRRVELVFFEPAEVPTLPCGADRNSCLKKECILYQTDSYERIIIPSMVSAKNWTASWDKQATPATFMNKRTMNLAAPDLPEGSPVTITVRQHIDNNITHTLPAIQTVSKSGSVDAEFSSWYNSERVGSRSTSGDFPKVSFSFVMETGGRRIESPQLEYRDLVHVRYKDSQGALANKDCVLYTRWGTRELSTDSSGIVKFDGIPPGGAILQMIGYNCQQ